MKKYIQYNAAQFAGPQVELGSRSNTVNIEKVKDIPGDGVLDLSGKHGQGPVSMATGQKWGGEQDSALDLSNCTPHMGADGQAEALDLSKPSQSRVDTNRGVPFSAPPGIHQSGHSLSQTPPHSSVTRPSSGQYSLLQAALNSTQTSTVAHPSFPDTSCLDTRARMFAALASLEASRGIKPFASGGPHRFGIPIPPLSYPNTPVTVVQGIHKPIAITAPQPHVSNPESKSQTSSHTTISVSGSSQLSHEEKDGRKMQYTSSIHRRGSISDKLLQESYQRDVERYVLQTQNGAVISDNTKVNLPLPNVVEGFTCVQCGKSYKTKAALKLHATVHKTSEERQYECPMCKRRFLHRHHLVVHQRKHSGEKPFKCDACGKTFMAIFLLHKHLRKHVRESGPNCQISTEQLTKLNLKRDTIDVSGIEKIPYRKVLQTTLPDPKPPIVLDDSVLPLTNADKLAKFYEMNLATYNKIKDIKGETKNKLSNVEVIDLSSDDLNSSHGSGMDQNLTHKTSIHSKSSLHQHVHLNTQEKWENRNISGSELRREDHSVTLVGDVSAQNGVLDSGRTINGGTHELSQDSKTEDTDTSDETEDQPVDVNPFPEYTSSDEVELDFETGELKIISKQTETTPVQEDLESNTNKISKDEETNIKHDMNSKDISAEQVEMVTTKMDEEIVTNHLPTSINTSGELDQDDSVTDINNTADKDLLNDVQGESVHSPSQSVSSTPTDRNIFTDVGQESVCKDMNMNEPDRLVVTDIQKDQHSTVDEVTEPKSETNNNPRSELPVDQALQQLTDLLQKPASNKLKSKGKKHRRRCKRVKCDVCSRTFHSDHHLILHMAVHKKNQMLQSLRKAKAQQMKSMGYQQQKTSVICKICKKTFKFQKSLNSHMRVHSEKMAKQKLLSKAFRDFMAEAAPSSRSTERTTSAESITLYKPGDPTETCDLDLGDLGDLGVKDKLINSYIESRDDCIEYLAQYSKNDRLEDPPIKVIIGKDNIKRFLCHACDNTYTTKQKLRMHALIHKDNCFLCDICGKSFFRLLTLEKHIATHQLPRPHICMCCKKSFIHRSSLMRHRVIHDKPNTPNIKQQVADISFELKMLDTYTMLRQERLEKIQKAKLNELHVDPANSMHHLEKESVNIERKSDILDLSVRIKTDDVSLPPVLSPANTPTSIQMNPVHLSPPVITGETSPRSRYEKQEPAQLAIKQEPAKLEVKREPAIVAIKEEPKDNLMSVNTGENEVECQSLDSSFEGKKKRTSDEMFGPKDITNDTFHKRSRKTRVYQTSCRVCKEQFPNVMTLKSHMSVHNMVETHLYECSVCHHRFTQSCSLLRHLKTSCQENRLKCLPCGKTFNLKHSYDQHMKLHNGLPPNLDGSFYDRRKDEVEGIQVKEEKEGDIENNNNTKHHMMPQTPLKVEPISTESMLPMESDLKAFPVESANTVIKEKCESVQDDMHVKQGPSGLADINYDSDDSDAKTYLYSEGECRLKDLSDFSDTEEVTARPPDFKESEPRPQSVESHSSSGVMTLNLLSAVCSDIRNAEKEEETRRKEIEERQKELETIEILANLKRGRMQQNNPVPSTSKQDTSSPANVHSDKPSTASFDPNNVIQSIIHNQVMMASGYGKYSANSDVNVTKPKNTSKPLHTLPHHVNKHEHSLPHHVHKHEPRNIMNIPQIPTVVFEIAAEAERLRQEKLAKMGQHDSRNINTLPNRDETKPSEFNPHTQFLHSLAQMTLHDRLALLMKGPLPPLASVAGSIPPLGSMSGPIPQQGSVPSMSSPGPSPTFTHKPSPSTPSYTVSRPHSDPTMSSGSQLHKNNLKTPPQLSPQDLSLKKHYSGLTGLPSASISSTSSPHFLGTRPSETGSRHMPPVPAFHCELCGKFIYNQTEYQQHLQEHLHNIQLKGQSLMNHHGNAGQRSWVLDRAQNLGVPHSHNHHPRERLTKNVHVPHTGTSTPPTSLDLTLKRFPNPVSSTQDVSSPTVGSDFSNDTIPSPSTPASSASPLNLDVLRKELRNKIYARRRSQGLEDLKVEFKPPEMTEMTEEELLKLDYRRECNRQAAQRSRMKKKDLLDTLIEELHEEEIVHSDLRRKLESLTEEKNYLLKTLENHSCVRDKP